ncbi:MAG: DUF885 domain-containing protein [Marinicaulis sp.]|nr:DUF885 domain-containing protein [Marinicaulis sp.]
MFRTLAVSFFAFSTAAVAAPTDDLNALIDEYWANEMEESPFGATSSGVFDYNDKVPQVSPEDHARRAQEAKDFAVRLEAIDRDSLSDEDIINADLLAFILKHDVALAQYENWRIPFLADTGFHTNFGYTINATPFRTEKDYQDFIKRLEALPGFIDQHIANMREGIAIGYTQPKEIIPNIIPSFEAQVTETAKEHGYYAPFNKFPASISKRKQKALTKAGKAALEDGVIPAFVRLSTFMKEEYLPNARETLGASELPNGKEFYEARVRYFTTLDDATAGDIHELGLKEVARIRKEMMDVIDETGFDGSFDEFLEFLRTDRQFYAETPQRLLERAAWIAKDIDGRLPKYFGKLPRQPYSVEPVPEDLAPNYTNARYVGAPLDADRGGQSWVNTYNHEIRPLYQLTAMALHEGVPGHHLQSALSKEIENVPQFRRQFYPHAFGEGWGLYSEKLGVEMGVYETPYDHFGRLTWEMWRAARLVIDTGLHSKGWTRQQAMDYLAGNTALSLHNVQTEVDRYIAWPGQALAYKMGELTIWELRAKAEKELGDRFDIRDFHDAILVSGGMPLEMLRDRIDLYIEEAKAGE